MPAPWPPEPIEDAQLTPGMNSVVKLKHHTARVVDYNRSPDIGLAGRAGHQYVVVVYRGQDILSRLAIEKHPCETILDVRCLIEDLWKRGY